MKIKKDKVDSKELCRLAFKLYEENTDPLKWEILRNFLKYAYEAIPEKQRHLVLGNMDLHDGPIRDIVYNEHNIVNWDYRKFIADNGDLFLPSFDGFHKRIEVARQSTSNEPLDYVKDKKMFEEAVNLAQQTESMTIVTLMKHFKISFARAVELAKELKAARVITHEVKYS
ncbi:hypothetical protein M1116_01915 [Patescibacteria group bacterium]|nr:hypothetical protein [Patescibacteria group bacterium]